jgi:hypothetical protein
LETQRVDEKLSTRKKWLKKKENMQAGDMSSESKRKEKK